MLLLVLLRVLALVLVLLLRRWVYVVCVPEREYN
jgi:hypothetical protein